MKIGIVIFFIFLGLMLFSFGLRWISGISDIPIDEINEESEITANVVKTNAHQEKNIEEHNCGDGLCAKGESHKTCSKDCGFSLLQECIKSCVSILHYPKDDSDEGLEMAKYVCNEQCYSVENEFNLMKAQHFSQEDKNFIEKEKENMLKTFIESYKNG